MIFDVFQSFSAYFSTAPSTDDALMSSQPDTESPGAHGRLHSEPAPPDIDTATAAAAIAAARGTTPLATPPKSSPLPAAAVAPKPTKELAPASTSARALTPPALSPTPPKRALADAYNAYDAYDANTLEPPAKKQRQKPKQKRRVVAAAPAPGSLFDTLRTHNGKSLFVLPILWTDMHTHLLRAAFVERPALLPAAGAADVSDASSADEADDDEIATNASDLGDRASRAPTPAPPVVSPARAARQARRALSCDLSALLSVHDVRPVSKTRAVKNVLAALFPGAFARPKTNADLDLHFGDRVYRRAVRIPVIWSTGGPSNTSNTPPAPMLAREASTLSTATVQTEFESRSGDVRLNGPTVAYLNRAYLDLVRQNVFRVAAGPKSGDVLNVPVSRLQRLRSKLLRPSSADRDAYVLGVFLAMAQAHFYDVAPPRPARGMWWRDRKRAAAARRADRMAPACALRDVALRIVVTDDESSDFVVYSATLTAAFLQQFVSPLEAADHDDTEPALAVTYQRVAAWPVAGLRERLGEAFGYDIVGEPEAEAKSEQAESEQAESEQAESTAQAQDESEIETEVDTEVDTEADTDKESEWTETGTAENETLAVPGLPSPTGSVKRKRSDDDVDVPDKSDNNDKSDKSDKSDNNDKSTPSRSPSVSPHKRRQRSQPSSLAVF